MANRSNVKLRAFQSCQILNPFSSLARNANCAYLPALSLCNPCFLVKVFLLACPVRFSDEQNLHTPSPSLHRNTVRNSFLYVVLELFGGRTAVKSLFGICHPTSCTRESNQLLSFRCSSFWILSSLQQDFGSITPYCLTLELRCLGFCSDYSTSRFSDIQLFSDESSAYDTAKYSMCALWG